MTTPVRIPADVERGDKILGPFTARQIPVLAATALGLYLAWNLTRTVIPPVVFLAGAGLICTLVAVAVLTRRDGLSTDQLARAAIMHRSRPRHLIPAPDGGGGFPAAPAWVTSRAVETRPRPPAPAALSAEALRLPHAVTTGGGEIGVVDLGADGLAVIAAASSVNLSLRTAAEQDSLVAQLGGWLHTLRQPVQLLIRSARLDITGHLGRLDAATADMSPELAATAADHAAHLADLAASENLIHHQVLLVWREPVTTTGGLSPAPSLGRLLPGHRRTHVNFSAAARRAAESRLLRRLSEATELLAPLGVSVTALDAGQASAVLASCTNPGGLVPATAEIADPNAIITTDTTQYPQPGLIDDVPEATTTGIVPESLAIGTRHLEVGSDWIATLAVSGFPREVTAGWLAPLLSHPGRVDLAVHVDPIDPVTAAARLKRQFARLESSRRYDAQRERPADPQVDVAVEDAADLSARVARAETRLFRAGIYLTVHADSEEALAEEVAAVRALAASVLMDTTTLAYRATQAWTTTLPLGLDRIGMRRTFDTTALAAAFPFDSPQLPTTDPIAATRPTGVLYGRDAAGGLTFVDRFSPEIHNHNMVVLGRSGAGKSYLVKTEILRSLYRGIEQIVIDPEDEYRPLAHAVGGVHIPLGAPGVRINPFDLDIRTRRDGRRTAPADALNRRKLFLHTLIRALTGDPTPAQRAALDTALSATYTAAGITPDPATWTRPAPTLSTLADQLTRLATPAAGELAASLHPYVGEGTHAGLLDGPTTLDPDGPMIVYSLRCVPDELRTIATLLVLDATWRRVSDPATRRPRMVTVDEAWLLMRQPAGAEFLHRAAKSFRKYLTGLTLCTQDCADVLSTDLGRAIVANAATQILLRQSVSASDEIATAFQLSDGEKQFLLTAARGSGLLAVGGTDRAVFASLASPGEHVLITTSPEFDLIDTSDNDISDGDTEIDIDLPTVPPPHPLTSSGWHEDPKDIDSDIEDNVFLDAQESM